MRKMWAIRLRRPVLVIGFCSAFIAGVLLAGTQLFYGGWWLGLPIFLLLVSLRRHGVVALLLLLMLGCLFGWWRGSVYMSEMAKYEALYGKKVVVVGRASEEAVYGPRYQLEFTMDELQVVSPDTAPLVGTLSVRGFGAPVVYRGDIVRVSGKLVPIRGNNVARISFAQLEVIGNKSNFVDVFRRKFAAAMLSVLPEPAASFALGILIGQRSTLPEAVSDQLRMVSLTHIIAVSGYNLTIIIELMRRLLAKRSKFQATFGCLALITLFLLITGTSPSIVRAGIISVIGITVWYFGRSIKPMVLLLTAIVITLLMNPGYIWGNVSWYLSFLAFFGVLVLAPALTTRIYGSKEPPMLIQVFIETICATIVTVPYILYIFGQTSLVSLPANLLVVPFIPLGMLLALIAGLAGMFIMPIAGWFAWPAKILLTYMLDVANLLSKVPHAFVENIEFPITYLVAGYACICWVCLILWLKTKPRKAAIITDKNSSK